MDLLNRAELRALMAERSNHCVSLYMPTHRTGPETQQDRIRFKNLLKQAEERLSTNGLRRADAERALEPAQRLLDDDGFWAHRGDGLAVFLAPETFRAYRLPYPFSELVVVTERFHIKPLLGLLSGDGRFYILALSQKEVRLLQGTRHSVGEVDLTNVPKSLAEALGPVEHQKQLQFHTVGRGSPAIFHGQGSAGDVSEHKKDLLLYFKQIDKGLQELVCAERVPLVLAGVDYLLPIYREANTCAELLDDAIVGSPEALSAEELHARAWAIVEPYFRREQERAAAQYSELCGTGRTAADLRAIVPAACQGRVDSLFVAVGVQRWGRYEPETGVVELHDERAPGDEDLLDLAAVETIARAGKVYAVESEQVPDTGSPAAAVFRY
jgi:hypothetical protein